MFSHVALLCALAGIAQFYAQFVFQAPWLFDFSRDLPWHLRGPSGYNTVIPVGELYKSNGFFLREPSHFSFLMALALLAELQMARRPLRLVTFGLALLLTYSGTGLLALSLGLMFPLGRRTLVQLLVLGVLGFVMFGLLGDGRSRGGEGQQQHTRHESCLLNVRFPLDDRLTRRLPPRQRERVDHGERRCRAAVCEHTLHGPAGGFGVEHGDAAATIAHTGQVNESALLRRGLKREQLTTPERPDLGAGRKRVDSRRRRCRAQQRERQSADNGRACNPHSAAFNQSAVGS